MEGAALRRARFRLGRQPLTALRTPYVSSLCFFQAAKNQRRAMMGGPNFWDNQEKAQQIITQLKPLNGLIKPYEELSAGADNLRTLVELAEEDAELEAELERELGPFEKQLAEFELRAMLS